MMRYKTYQAETLQQAILKMTIDLGKDALLVSHRTVRKGGIFGLFGKRVVEVTGAVPVDLTKEVNVSKAAADDTIYQSDIKNKRDLLLSDIQRDIQELKRRIDGIFEETKAVPAFVTKYPGKSKELYAKLIENEVQKDLAEELIESLIAGSPPSELENKEFLKRQLETQIKNLIRTSGPIYLDGRSPKIVTLVGPTGVGKTTTLAKLVADFAFSKRKKVALITIDTYRVAAVEQLKTYASILDIPIEVVFSPNELKSIIDTYCNVDLIFIDTAGRSQRNEVQMFELKNFIESAGYTLENYLLISAVTKYKDMLDIVNNFKRISIHKIIFTKLDETVTYGPMLSLLAQIPQAVAYVTTGQSVPEDIEVADATKLAKMIIGE